MQMNDQHLNFEELLLGTAANDEEITDRQWQILEAAIKIFSEKGYEGSRTSEIAKEANIAEGTIFRYYKTKKDLLVGLLFPLVTKFFRPLVLNSVEKIINNKKQKSIELLLKEILMDRLSLANKNSALVKTIAIESIYHPELLDPIRKEIAPKFLPLINNFFDSNIKNGNLRDLNPNLITRSMMSLLTGFVILRNIFPEYFTLGSDEAEIENIVDLMLNGISNSKIGKEGN